MKEVDWISYDAPSTSCLLTTADTATMFSGVTIKIQWSFAGILRQKGSKIDTLFKLVYFSEKSCLPNYLPLLTMLWKPQLYMEQQSPFVNCQDAFCINC